MRAVGSRQRWRWRAASRGDPSAVVAVVAVLPVWWCWPSYLAWSPFTVTGVRAACGCRVLVGCAVAPWWMARVPPLLCAHWACAWRRWKRGWAGGGGDGCGVDVRLKAL
ncbi:hypothetical protein TraAM80_07441 [Trypanosoma rangeli]|uniref:Uncharacterized protein n=1 Tax=Trypanosoma rangeli TaxID=5698 RepID=A0A422N5H8_TRYRA|nr:uncharacterized protein TraAM80_07441 [Trypanosoma rangeli]RNF00716.1 hypothetical protein TraAM80_07441 [Trypanosoma rangeli]|eukprot:RNF00716.1 hypothetical protein TraAM80_07441 [Trypanosoma rangeli]